jgi:hypothetical protein
VVVHDPDIVSTAARPAKTDAELIVHANAPLADAVVFQPFQPVRGQRPHASIALGQVKLIELAQRRALNVRELGDASQFEQGLGVGASEALDRAQWIVTRHIHNVKRDYDGVNVEIDHQSNGSLPALLGGLFVYLTSSISMCTARLREFERGAGLKMGDTLFENRTNCRSLNLCAKGLA